MAPKKAIATLATRAISIVIVNAVTNRGEKVFNAYILGSIRFIWVGWCVGGLARLLSLSLLFGCQS